MKAFRAKGVLRLIAVALALAVAGADAYAATVTAQYVKTLGQSNATGKFAFVTSGGRIAVDEAGNIYFGTPGGGSYLQKVTPQGEILWQFMYNTPGFQGTAVDEQYLYACGSGYYGYRQLMRIARETGQQAPGWQYQWKDKTTPENGVRPLSLPLAVAVDDQYLYVADSGGDEVRRFDKSSGAEVPFPQRLLLVSPLDLALTPQGTLLILTKSTVIEVSKDGAPLRVPVIKGLRAPASLDVDRTSGAVYVAEGGDNAELINRIRVFDPNGQLVNEIGIGGEFSGRWHPQSFSFTSGGDVTLDGKGGFWVNAFGARFDRSPLLTHFPNTTMLPQPDRILYGTVDSGIAVDGDLSIYLGGVMKRSWDDQLLWTSGLVAVDTAGLFPTTPPTAPGWELLPVYSDGKTTIIVSPQTAYFYQVNARNGAYTGKAITVGGGVPGGWCVVGNELFFVNGNGVQRTSLDLAAPQPFLKLPATAAPANGALAVSADRQRVYLSDKGEIACYGRDGAQLWKAPGTLGVLWKGVLFVTNSTDAGVVARDAQSGAQIAVFGDKAEGERPPLTNIHGMAVGSKAGAEYLFVLANAGVLVFRISVV
jgi:outer membrane protein assembly factor BamB